MKASSSSHSFTNTNLDFLRAVAVLLVVAGHLTAFFGLPRFATVPLAGLGGLGVAIFFVHTALVLMLSLEREAQKSPVLFVPFMIRRCFRIYPLSMLMVLLIAFFHLPQATVSVGHFSGWNFDPSDVLSNLFLVQNLSFRSPMLGPMWSLAYELEMYLLLPAIFLVVTRTKWKSQLSMFVVAVIACAGVVQSSATRNLAFFAPCFLGGIVAYQLRNRVGAKAPSYAWPIFVAASAVLYLKSSMTQWEEWTACLLLGLAIPVFATIRSQWVNAATETIAKYSYGIYLTHFFVIWLAFEKCAAAPIWLQVSLFLTFAAALPVIFYHLVEDPMIQRGKRIAQKYIAQRKSRDSRQPELSERKSIEAAAA